MIRPLAAAVAFLLLVPQPGGAQARTPLAGAQAVLDQRVEALRARDRTRFAATIDPKASEAFRRAQLRQFDGLVSVPVERYSLTARIEDSGDFGPTVRRHHDDAERVFLPETEQRYRLRGYDDRDAVETLWLTFVERGGRWYVAADTDLSPVALDTTRNLWDLGPVRVVETEHFLVLSRPAQATRADALARVAEDAVALIDKRWPLQWSRRIPLVLPGSVDELEEMLQSTVDLDKFVAFVSYGAIRDDSYEASAPRIYINDRNLSRYGRRTQVETLAHELSHAAAVPLAGPMIPIWVHEGVAELVARGAESAGRKPSGDSRLPRDHEFVSGSGASIVRAYAEARTAIATLSRVAGASAPSALVAELGRVRVAPGNADHHLDAALRRVARIGLPELERAWAAGR